MSPKKKVTRRPSQRRQQDVADQARDISPPSSRSVDVVAVGINAETQVELSSEEEPTVQQKKRIRVSKKEIPEYKWTYEGTRKLAEYVKDYPQLYDKRQKDWLNVAAKSQLWTKAGEQQEPPATGYLFSNSFFRVFKCQNEFCMIYCLISVVTEFAHKDCYSFVFNVVFFYLFSRFTVQESLWEHEDQSGQDT